MMLTPRDSSHGMLDQTSYNTSSVVEFDIVGSRIEEDAQSLVGLLTKQDTTSTLLVFAIVGIGGVGKTTLAQKIYHDQNIKDEFMIRMWVSVTQEFTETKLLRDLIISAGGNIPDSSQSRSFLEPMVESMVRGMKFFLVLDDVWTDRVWDGLLRNALMSGAPGSRVLVTSRNQGVANQMKARYCHQVELLPLEEGWLLLCKKAGFSMEEAAICGLEDIGMEIVNKCEGLPLAIVTIGRVLSKDRRRSAWEVVLNSSAWSTSGLPDDINNALYLSYLDLPSELKQCFLYCSLLPKNERMQRFIVVPLWISEGFIKAQGVSFLEELGESYYNELVWRNLIQPEHVISDQRNCTMHDLLRSLGQFLTRDENMAVGEVQELSNRIRGQVMLRRLSIAEGVVTTIPDVLRGQASLRTLLMRNRVDFSMDSFLSCLHRLRVLDLVGSGIKELPDSLGSLIHLRLLNLSFTPIKSIPETLGNLRNLQFLTVQGCHLLHRIPNSIVGLHNLRRLDFLNTDLEGMPMGLGRLEHLNFLQGFPMNWDRTAGWSTLEELHSLRLFRDLEIHYLESVADCEEARRVALMEKHYLKVLRLHCMSRREDGGQITEDDVQMIEKVFEELRPPPCLEILVIGGYFGSEFPSWLMQVDVNPSTLALSSLTKVEIHYCFCPCLPCLGLLPNLEHIRVEVAPKVVSVGHEFLGINDGGDALGGHSSFITSFPKLRHIEIEGMIGCKEWKWDITFRAMPCLQEFEIDNCRRLRSLPEAFLRHTTSLTDMRIEGADSLKEFSKHDVVKHLELGHNHRMERVSDLPALKYIWIDHCPRLVTVTNLPSLKTMVLTDLDMDSLPQWLTMVKPERLDIGCKEELMKKIILMEEGPEWSKIQHIGNVNLFGGERVIHASYTKTPFSFSTSGLLQH